MIKSFYYKFISLGGHWQIVGIIIVSTLVITLFSTLFGFENSLKIFLDPGSFDTSIGFLMFIEFILLVCGIVLSGMVIGTIVSGFEKLGKDAELYNIHKVLKEAFDTISSIKTRKILKELELISKTRMYDLVEAEIRLELTNDDILLAIRTYGDFRLRVMKNTKNVVIEYFEANKVYGSNINRQGKVTIIATQNYSDAGVGHFSSTLASNLGANYISNEFYSTGAPLKEKHINFANNSAYINYDSQSENNVSNDFKNDLKNLCQSSSLIIYLGTCNDQRPNHVHVLFGGELGNQGFDIKDPTFDNIDKLKVGIEKLRTNLNELSYSLATHEEFRNTNKEHLSRSIHKETKTNVLTIYVSTAILWSEDDIQYYKVMRCIADFINDVV